MKLLVADKLSERHLDDFAALGLEISYRPELSAAELPSALAGVAVLVVRSTQVSAEAIETAGETLRDLRVAEITKLDVRLDNGRIVEYRARVMISFKFEGAED